MKRNSIRKALSAAAAAAAMALLLCSPVYAGQWKQGTGENAGKWWYDNENGTYAKNGWKWIDGNGDGIFECYCFDQNGWLYVSTVTPDRKNVNESGAWVRDGVVVTTTEDDAGKGSDISGLGTLEPKVYNGIEFSIENLGVSDMAIGSIMYPNSNTATVDTILEGKAFYETGSDSYWQDSAQQAAVDAFVSQWVSQNINASMSEDEKCRKIFDWLVQNVTYDSQAPNSQSSYGALIERRCVCGGFANAYMSLGKACGLDVKFILAPNHGFNMVKISGEWYLVDATQNKYKDRSATAIYYLHTIPVGDSTVEEKAAQTAARYANRSNKVAAENERVDNKAQGANQKGYVFQADDADLIPSLLDCLYSEIEGKNSSQGIEMVLYTGGREFQQFNKLSYSYNGNTGRIDDVLEAAIIGQNVNGFTIGDTSSCNIRWQKNTSTTGGTFVTTWKDEGGNDYVIIDFNINPQR